MPADTDAGMRDVSRNRMSLRRQTALAHSPAPAATLWKDAVGGEGKLLRARGRASKIAKRVVLHGSDWRARGIATSRQEAVGWLNANAGFQYGRLVFKCRKGKVVEIAVF